MATFWEIDAHSVNHMLSCILTICNIRILDISRSGFEGWIWVLIASGPDICILLAFKTKWSK